MDEFERRIVDLLDEAVPEPEHDLALSEVQLLTRPRRATVRRRQRMAARRRIQTSRRPRRGLLAVVGAVCAAAIIGIGSYLLTGGAGGPDRTVSAAGPPVITEPTALTSARWRLTEITLPGRPAQPASAPVVFSFGHGGASDDVGDAAIARVAAGRITFGIWANNLLTYPGPRLKISEEHAAFRVMHGAVSWSIRDDTLTINHHNVGTLTFRVSTQKS